MRRFSGWSHALILSTLMSAAFNVAVAQEAEGEDGGVLIFEGARIRGNQELPNVLYVVPWRALETGQSETAISPGKLVDPTLGQPIYREEFRRYVGYHERFMAGQPPAEASPAP